ncbi:MAG: HIT domain-containing protein [Alphaproteobacteria bacterium]|nr:HIT domain-containing protein [Alphaproteobacteria bacterium]
MTDAFELHPQLAADTYLVGQTALCQVLLSKDARYPWLILVPHQPDLRELHDLSAADQAQLMAEITHISAAMQKAWTADKVNVAALGNMVPQLHIHIIMRYRDDVAWPGPIWGVGTAQDYSDAALSDALTKAANCLP